MDIEEWIKKSLFSFIIGFIITIITGVILALIFSDVTNQSIILIGGLPLSWLRLILGIPYYDSVALILDIMFWTFVIFLIKTRKKEEKKPKQKPGSNIKKNICWACGQKVPPFHVAHILEDGTRLCDECFKKYEKR